MQKLIQRVGAGATAVLLAAGVLGAQAPGASARAGGSATAGSSKTVAGAVTALRQHSTELRLTKGQSFRATDTVLDRSGASHVRLSRSYRGLPVLGGDLVVHRAADGSWAGVSRTLTAPLRMSTTPRLSKEVAQARAVRPTKATRGISHLEAKGAPRLVVDTIGHRARLAWAVTTGGRHQDGTPSRMTSYVDARSGTVLRREEGIETVDGSGQSLYSGTVPLKVTQSGSTYQLKDPTRGNTYTTDFNNATDSFLCQLFGFGCQTGTTFTSPTTTFGNGTTSNRASAGVDAQYGTNETWDYYNQVHGRNGIFGNGTGSLSLIHI